MGEYGLTFLDYSDEKSAFRVRTGPVNVATIDTVSTQTASLKSAIAALCSGVIASERLYVYDNFLSRTPPTTPASQRENKWLVVYEGNSSHRLFRTELPTANLAHANVPGSDRVNLADGGVWATFKSDFEAVVVDEDGTSGVTVIYVQFVGRRT